MAEVKLPPTSSSQEKQTAQTSQRQPREKLEPKIGKEEIVSTRKSFGAKFKEAFIQMSGPELKDYLFKEALLPWAKHTFLDTVSMIFFHEHIADDFYRRDSYYDRYGNRGRAYSGYYGSNTYGNSARDRDRKRPTEYYRRDDRVDYKNIILRSRGAAEDIVSEMQERIYRFGQVSVAELFDMLNVSSEAVDNSWGWTDERDIGIRSVSSGWLIDLKEARYLG